MLSNIEQAMWYINIAAPQSFLHGCSRKDW
jgi:hypothetical protein